MKTIKITLTKEEAERFNLLKSRLGFEGKKLTPVQNAELIHLIRGVLGDVKTIEGVRFFKKECLCMGFGDSTYYRFATIL